MVPKLVQKNFLELYSNPYFLIGHLFELVFEADVVKFDSDDHSPKLDHLTYFLS